MVRQASLRKTWDEQFPAFKVSWMLKKASLSKNSLINQEPRSERKSPYCIVSENRFNETWFLNCHPLVGVSVFIANLSKR